MKRWYPVFFLGLSLLANIVVEVRYAQFLAGWTPASDYTSPQPLGAFALFSVPVGLAYLWRTWRPCRDSLGGVSRARRVCGNALLLIFILFWVYFCVAGVVSAWVAETSTADQLNYLRQSSNQHYISALSLILGGLFALWLKGMRIPPKST